MPPITNKDFANFEIALNTLVNEIVKFGSSLTEAKSSIDDILNLNSSLIKNHKVLIQESVQTNSLLKELLNKSDIDTDKSLKNIEATVKLILSENKKGTTKPFLSFIKNHSIVIQIILFAICINTSILLTQQKNEKIKRDALKYRLILKFSSPSMKKKYNVWDSTSNKYTIEELEEFKK